MQFRRPSSDLLFMPTVGDAWLEKYRVVNACSGDEACLRRIASAAGGVLAASAHGAVDRALAGTVAPSSADEYYRVPYFFALKHGEDVLAFATNFRDGGADGRLGIVAVASDWRGRRVGPALGAIVLAHAFRSWGAQSMKNQAEGEDGVRLERSLAAWCKNPRGKWSSWEEHLTRFVGEQPPVR